MATDPSHACPGSTSPRDAWLAVREQELGEVERQRALCHLLMDLGSVCSGAECVERLLSAVIVRVAMGLGARNGWIVREAAPAPEVYGTGGRCSEPEAEALRACLLLAGSARRDPAPSVLGGEALARLPGTGKGSGQAAVLAPVLSGSRAAGWIVLVGERSGPLVEDALSILGAVAALVAAALERLDAVEALRRHRDGLAHEVARGTEALQVERSTLETRVRERTFQMERAKQAVLDSERALFERERVEGVHRLAAGVAHTLNNPLAALIASLDFLGETLADCRPGNPIDDGDMSEMRAAVGDALVEAHRMVELVKSRFGEAARSRRAAIRTDLANAVRDALAHHGQRTGCAVAADVRLERGVAVGIAGGELSRWVLRMLELGGGGGAGTRVRAGHCEGVPTLELVVPRPEGELPTGDLVELCREVEDAGGDLRCTYAVDRKTTLRLRLPPGVGAVAPAAARERAK
jgi:signal transduction histidine kinase